jgi:hypothetical protein
MTIYINLAVEDDLSEAVLRKILSSLNQVFQVKTVYQKGGFGYLKKQIKAFNEASQHIPFLVLTDLDKTTCPVELITDWIKFPRNPNLIFRVAVREVESWILADRESFAQYLGLQKEQIPRETDLLDNPKETLFQIVKKCSKREIKNSILPMKGAKIGPDYNGKLSQFIKENWKAENAQKNSESLKRIIQCLNKFEIRC